ncbi:hypothetical protein ACVWW4_008703 [Bradyrhizobium sp. LB7.1]
MAAPGTDLAQQFGDAPDQPALGSQHLAIDIGDLPFPDRDRNDGPGIIIDGRFQPGIADVHRPHALRRLLGRGRIAREQSERDPALRLRQAGGQLAVGGARDRHIELVAQRRQAGEQLGATINQRRDPLQAAAIGRRAAR